jgi:O-antigen ligase/polysaccharide polymerase Wzy-like membrane protein
MRLLQAREAEAGVVTEPPLRAPARRLLFGALLALLAVVLLEHELALLTTAVKPFRNALVVLIALLAPFAGDLRPRSRIEAFADAAMATFVVALAVSTLKNDVPLRQAAEGSLVYLRGPAVFYAWRAVGRDLPDRARSALLWFAAVAGFVAILQFFVGERAYDAFGWGGLNWWFYRRAQGFFNHPNHLGHVAVAALLGGVPLLATRTSLPKIDRRMLVLAAAFAMAALVFANSRESWVGFILGAGICAVASTVKDVRRLLAIGCIALVLGVGALVGLSTQVRHALGDRIGGLGPGFNPSTPGGIEGETRVYYLKQSLKALGDKPALGHGPGMFGGSVASKYSSPVNEKYKIVYFDSTQGQRQSQVDTSWGQMAGELGVIGVGSMLLWLGTLALAALGVHRAGGDNTGATLIGAGIVAATTFYGLLAPALVEPLASVLMATIAGAALARTRAGSDA